MTAVVDIRELVDVGEIKNSRDTIRLMKDLVGNCHLMKCAVSLQASTYKACPVRHQCITFTARSGRPSRLSEVERLAITALAAKPSPLID